MSAELKIVDSPVKYRVHHVDPMMVWAIWDECVPILERACKQSHGDVTIEGILVRLMNGNNLLIIVRDESKIVAACTLNVGTNDSGMKYMYIPIVSGDHMDCWMDDFFKVIIAIAKDLGCSQLRGMSVRKGWLKKLNSSGYNWRLQHEVVTYELGEY